MTAALIIVELNQSRGLSLRLAYYGGGYLVALTLAHLMTSRFAPYADPVLLPLVALLNGIGPGDDLPARSGGSRQGRRQREQALPRCRRRPSCCGPGSPSPSSSPC